VCGAAGALLLAIASVAPRLRMNRRSWSLVVAAAIAFWLTALTLLLISSFGEHVPMGAQASMPTSLPDLDVPAGVVALMGLNALLFAIAAVGFLREAERRGDEFSAWLAIAAILAAFSRLNYLVMPTRYTDWVYVGDGFWLLCCIVLLIGALREITSYWRSATEAAVLEERRRIARDLHDGVAQELAYLDRNLRSFEPLTDRQHERLSRLQRAVERAQRESRQALAALAAPVDAPLDVALSRAATEVADRFGIELELDLASGARVSPARTESLLRIACEAVTNAARHSGQRFVSVSLEYDGDDVRLRVRDPGRGFDPTASSSGFGLVSMRDRARAAGGELRVESSPGRGTLVEVAL
jgi:signal transduction histidine kinase